jgi:predicted nucleic acid-binding Zn ribbon protein|tara:strand:- start:5697 stop:6083 length:387 start_codon:yes stop_codon:yes gene_type:complete
MPLYTYRHPDTGEEKDILQMMNDEHIYIDEFGLEWKRVFTVPHASIDTKLDAFDKNGFIEKSGKMQGTVGDMLDYSAELSQERAERSETGEDPIKRKNFDDYEKRNGKKHLSDVKKTIETSKIRVDLD